MDKGAAKAEGGTPAPRGVCSGPGDAIGLMCVCVCADSDVLTKQPIT